jgi:hypothetical protein
LFLSRAVLSFWLIQAAALVLVTGFASAAPMGGASEHIHGEPLVLGSIVFSVSDENLAGDSVDIQAVLLDSVIGLEAGNGSFILDGAGNPVDLAVGAGGGEIGMPMRATVSLLAASLCLFVFYGRRRDTDWHRL